MLKANREGIVERLFESFGVKGVFLGPQGVMTLAASGKTTGLVLDVGQAKCRSIAVVDGNEAPGATEMGDVSGRAVTDYV